MSKAMNKAEKAHVSAVVRLGCIFAGTWGIKTRLQRRIIRGTESAWERRQAILTLYRYALLIIVPVGQALPFMREDSLGSQFLALSQSY